MSHKNHLKTLSIRIQRIALAAVLATVCALPAQITHAEPDAPAISATVQPPCDTASFDAAWDLIQIGLGGTLTFNCGNAPLFISLSGTKTITKQVTINGGGNITLSGGYSRRHFVINAGAALTLTNINIAAGGGGFIKDAGGAIQNFGTLTVLTSTFHNNFTSDQYGGGAIYSRGVLRIDNSTFRNNTAGNGGAIFNEIIGGSSGNASITNSQILSNTAKNFFGGGVVNQGILRMEGGLIEANRAGTNGVGGGIYSRGLMILRDVLISSNEAGYSGGGIYAESLLGDAYQHYSDLNRVTVDGNSAQSGAGIQCDYECDMYISHSTISRNTALAFGGGVNMYQANRLEMENVTLASNVASGDGGFVGKGGGISGLRSNLMLKNVTVAGNLALEGGGLHLSYPLTATLLNTIIADSPLGGNCTGPVTLSAAYSLSSDNTCALIGTGNKSNTDPMLNPLGDYGGGMLTHLPKAGSPAIDGVIGSNAPATDQRGFPRPAGAGYDIGAVEVQPPAPPPPPPPPPNSIVPRIRIPIVNR